MEADSSTDDQVDTETPEQLRSTIRDLRAQISDIQKELNEVRQQKQEYKKQMEMLRKENSNLQTSPEYIGTVEDVLTGGVIIRQHGTNQEMHCEAPPQTDLEPGARVGLNQQMQIQSVIDDGVSADVKTMAVETSPDVTYDDIGGLEAEIQTVREMVELPLTDPVRFEEVGIDPPSGVLLHGPPGTGKTMVAKAVANTADATFIKLAGSELAQKFIGEGARMVRELFDLAEEHESAIIFIDEIDAIGSSRSDSKSDGDAEIYRTLTQLLAELDGFEERDGLKVLAATNRVDMLDEALLRPGRFDRQVEVGIPSHDARKEILDVHLEGITLEEGVSLDELAGATDGMTGAELESVCTEAGMAVVREGRSKVRQADLEQAIEEVEQAETDERAGPGLAFA